MALEPATGPFVQLFTRLAQFELADEVDRSGSWAGKFSLSEEAREGLAIVQQDIEKWNGQLIPHISNAILLQTILGESDHVGQRSWSGRHPDGIIAGDASNKASCSYSIKGTKGFFLQRQFSETESVMSSGMRELLTVLHALQYKEAIFKEMQPDKRMILWLTDSAIMVTFLTKGSTKPHVQRVILDILRRLHKIGAAIKPIHISREDFRIQVADEGTRFFDADDWSIDRASYIKYTVGKRIAADIFVHASNSKAEIFFSYGKCPGTSGVDAFTQDWGFKEWAWVCPPTNLVIETIKKIAQTRMKAVLIVPKWQTADFWPYLCPDGQRA